MKKQAFIPRAASMNGENTVNLRTYGIDQYDMKVSKRGRDWCAHQVLRKDTTILNAFEGFQSKPTVGYTRHDAYIKINFWLSGKHTTVLDGYGEFEHERPEVFITAGPSDMIKTDLFLPSTHVASIAICLLKEFFPEQMGIDPDQLPQPLRGLAASDSVGFAAHRFALTPDLVAAARAILSAPSIVRRQPLYVEAKAIEMMCLLINRLEGHRHGTHLERNGTPGRREWPLHEARELLELHFAEPLTLERICRDVGINKMALTSGFRHLFGISVHDCLQKIRMEKAYELLQDQSQSIARIAEAVGYRHSCNFSTAFRAYFGFAPQGARKSQYRVTLRKSSLFPS